MTNFYNVQHYCNYCDEESDTLKCPICGEECDTLKQFEVSYTGSQIVWAIDEDDANDIAWSNGYDGLDYEIKEK
jgi:hypothetical protein